MACVVVNPGMTLTADEVVAHCRRKLATYKIPRRVEAVLGAAATRRELSGPQSRRYRIGESLDRKSISNSPS